MPTWGEINVELSKQLRLEAQRQGQPRDPLAPSPHDLVRRKYLRELAEHTGRPVIVYASAWLEGRPVADQTAISVSTRDMMGFMEAVHGLTKGPLDLILHSPGGDQNAAEALMKYLRDQGFGPIRAIVPISAMSAATMMALCCDDADGAPFATRPHRPAVHPHDTRGATGLARPGHPRPVDQAKQECAAQPQAIAAWLPILRSYAPGLLSQCVSAQEGAEQMVSTAMQAHMFASLPEPERAAQAKKVAEWFNDHKTHRSHGKPLRYEDVRDQGVRVSLLEDDGELQDRVLSAWHGIQLSLTGVAVLKLIENSNGKAWLLSGSPGFILAPGPPQQPQLPTPPPTSNPIALSAARAVARSR